MSDTEYEWTYHGADEKYRGKSFKRKTGCILVDDCEILAKGRNKDRTFFLKRIDAGIIYGYWIRYAADGLEKVPYKRTAGHVLPCFAMESGDNDDSTVTMPDATTTPTGGQSTTTVTVPDATTTPTGDQSTPSVTAPNASTTPTGDQSTPSLHNDETAVPISSTLPDAVKDSISTTVPDTADAVEVPISATVPDTVSPPTGDDSTPSVDTGSGFIILTGYKQKLRPRPKTPQVVTPKKRKKRKAKDGTVVVRSQKHLVERYKRGKFAAEDGGLVDPKTPNKGRLPLSQHENRRLQRELRPSGAHNLIYMVRGWKHERSKWFYEGRAYNVTKGEFLTVEWLNQNYMDRKWRKRTLQRYPRHWFRVPVAANASREAICLPYCLAMFYDSVGLTKLGAKLRAATRYGSTFHFCVNFVYFHGGFLMEKPKLPEFDILVAGHHPHLYLLQISAVCRSTQCLDNAHSICVYRGFIFDVNHDHALPLNKENLDKCCLGGDDWVFHHTSRVREFIPGKRFKSYFS